MSGRQRAAPSSSTGPLWSRPGGVPLLMPWQQSEQCSVTVNTHPSTPSLRPDLTLFALAFLLQGAASSLIVSCTEHLPASGSFLPFPVCCKALLSSRAALTLSLLWSLCSDVILRGVIKNVYIVTVSTVAEERQGPSIREAACQTLVTGCHKFQHFRCSRL